MPDFPLTHRLSLLGAAALLAVSLAVTPDGWAQPTPSQPAPGDALAAARAGFSPGQAEAQQKIQQGVQQFTLPNGLTVIVKPDHRAPTAVHMLWVRVGAMDEVSGLSGVAHVLEHMMFKGTDKLKPGEFSRRVAALGGRENAFTSYDYTGYYQQVPADKLGDVMALEANRFAHNQWSDDEFAKELEVVKEERRMRTEDNPHALMFEQQRAATFVASPYRRPVVGWMGDLDALKAQDARDFLHRWYTPANAAVVVVGDVDPQTALQLVQQHYGGIQPRALPPRKPQPEPAQAGMRRIEVKAPAEQALVSLDFKVPQLSSLEPSPDNDDALALTVLSAVLDGYSGARLERALTQGPDRVADSASSSNGLMGRGPQTFSLSGVPAEGKTASQVEAALRAQVARIAKEGVGEAELRRVKTQWVASQVYKRDSVMGQAQELGHLWIQGLPLDADDRLIERLRQITPAQVQAVAAKYFGDDQLTVATLLPQPRDPNAKPRQASAGMRH
ncbi:M16 family metallopeptidase [Ottowia sp.]|uniref:M16 family metallopeptidase n=1 Tax=Ottowia sp. TaxID=1898956 RepID=UPI003A8B42E7